MRLPAETTIDLLQYIILIVQETRKILCCLEKVLYATKLYGIVQSATCLELSKALGQRLVSRG